ncbi:hypothetical protein JRQ81_014460 [Phrynocephalus forsythii]|uniref:WAP domain-containing protein n=1 Tax=Phrynocephalus forsythii TaxID=171643 RepID=A0A9Q1B3J3_9SAUR|nr:hypothetical protein JRQ81_014460 [Phrynocephalus forsythii]
MFMLVDSSICKIQVDSPVWLLPVASSSVAFLYLLDAPFTAVVSSDESVTSPPASEAGHPGYCLLLPWRHPAPSGGGSCSACSVDVDCPPEKKCCGSACGNTCQAPASSVCQLPLAVGPCKARIRQFYYHWANKRCERFDYGGCLGNLN